MYIYIDPYKLLHIMKKKREWLNEREARENKTKTKTKTNKLTDIYQNQIKRNSFRLRFERYVLNLGTNSNPIRCIWCIESLFCIRHKIFKSVNANKMQNIFIYFVWRMKRLILNLTFKCGHRCNVMILHICTSWLHFSDFFKICTLVARSI